MNAQGKKKQVIEIVIFFGIISLLGDMVYEGARSANAQYFNLLGISAAKVGFVFGLGELIGYGLRLIAGVASDKTAKYWTFIIVGYGMLVVVPLMGWTSSWGILCVWLLLERFGKALRNPAKDTILSTVANQQLGVAFGVQEALDQVGAFLGPLIFTVVFALRQGQGIEEYRFAYKLLILPFIALMAFLFFARKKIIQMDLMKIVEKKKYKQEKLTIIFWYYLGFTMFCTIGFANFSVIGYHLKAQNIMSDGSVTMLYSFAMIVDAGAALIVGTLYDRRKQREGKKTSGLKILAVVPFFTVLIPLLAFTKSTILIILGMIFFGIVMGIHETIMRSAIADITSFFKRGTGYGVFNFGYGLALFLGSTLFGYLYDVNGIIWIIVFTIIVESISLVIYGKMVKVVDQN